MGGVALCLERPPRSGFVGGMFLAATYESVTFIDLSSYPRWLVVLVATLAVALILWIMMKVLKLALWLVLFAVLLGGLGWAGWLLIH